MKKTTKLEKLQKEINKIGFIKSYPILGKLDITPLDRLLIELVLSYQDNKQELYMNYRKVAETLCVGRQSIKNSVCRLKKKGYIITDNTTNYNGSTGGSSTKLFTNLDKIIEDLKSDEVEPEPEPLTQPKDKEKKTIFQPVDKSKVERFGSKPEPLTQPEDKDIDTPREILKYFQYHDSQDDLFSDDITAINNDIRNGEVKSVDMLEKIIEDKTI
jgi:hypothetical protein